MGLDVYCKIIVGVRLMDHATLEGMRVKEKRYNIKTGELVDDIELEALILTTWDGERYEAEWPYHQSTTLPNIYRLKHRIRQYDGLDLFTSEVGPMSFYSNIIGVQVGNNLSTRSAWLCMAFPEITDEIVESVRQNLLALGINAKPSAYIQMEIGR